MKIDKNIPFIKRYRISKYDFLKEMEVGDSVLVKERSIAIAIVSRASVVKPGWSFRIRTVEDGFRTWRVD